MGFQGSNASGRRIVLLPGAFWAHGASKMAILGASFLLCILQCFRVWEGMLPPGACRMSHASARRIVSCRGLCVSSLCSQIPLAPAPTFGAFRSVRVVARQLSGKNCLAATSAALTRRLSGPTGRMSLSVHKASVLFETCASSNSFFGIWASIHARNRRVMWAVNPAHDMGNAPHCCS